MMEQDVLLGERLILRPMSPVDKRSIYEIFNDPKVIESYGEKIIPTPQSTEVFMSKISQHGNRVWTIRLMSDVDRVIGICALHHWNKEDKTIEIGATLHSGFWGKQITFEAFGILLSFIEDSMDIRQVLGKTARTNINAIRLIQKLGFIKNRIFGSEVWYIKNIKRKR